MNRVGLGVIGCGNLARGRADKLAGIANQDVIMAMDIVEDHARALAEKAGNVPYTTELEDVLGREDITAVYIATPHASHAELCIAAAERGKHVLVEKPLATTREDGQRMIRACRDRGLVLAVGYNRRFYAETVKLQQLLAAGAIGDIVHTRYGQHGFKEQERYTTWRGDPAEAGGGQLFDNGTHFHDVTRCVTGLDIDEVYAQTDTIASPEGIEDYTTILLRYRNSRAKGIFEVTGFSPGTYRFRVDGELCRSFGMDILGTEGQVYWDGFLNVFTTRDVEGLEKGSWTRLPWTQTDVVTELHTDFVEAILEGRSPRATGEDGLATVDFVLSAYESARKRTPVCLRNLHLES